MDDKYYQSNYTYETSIRALPHNKAIIFTELELLSVDELLLMYPNLQCMNIRSNIQVDNYIFLKELYINDWIGITELPPTLVNLKYLFCSHNKLTTVPYYPKLKTLVCRNNLINYLPDYPELVNLDCHWNGLTILANYPKLECLRCSYNNITKIPDYKNLKLLICQFNRLTIIPEIQTLESINCEDYLLPQFLDNLKVIVLTTLGLSALEPYLYQNIKFYISINTPISEDIIIYYCQKKRTTPIKSSSSSCKQLSDTQTQD